MKRITGITLTPSYDDQTGLLDATVRVEYSDGTGGGGMVSIFAYAGALSALWADSSTVREAMRYSWIPWEKP